MTKEEATLIMAKKGRCIDRIISTSICERIKCKDCELNVNQKQIKEAREVLEGEEEC